MIMHCKIGDSESFFFIWDSDHAYSSTYHVIGCLKANILCSVYSVMKDDNVRYSEYIVLLYRYSKNTKNQYLNCFLLPNNNSLI